MGYTNWDPGAYSARQQYRAATGKSFAFSQAMSSRPQHLRQVHPSLDPKWVNSAGQKVRESRFSGKHPNARPVGVLFDQTGSMGEGPRILQKKLGGLNGVLLRRGYLEDPQILFGAIGDARNGEVAPLQAGQFESGVEMDAQLDNIFLEGNGGGNGGESYGLALYFFARHTASDAWDKRRQKGYLFLTGDECPHPVITRAEIERYIGDKVEGDIRIEDLIREVRQRYHLFFLHVNNDTAQWQNSRRRWKDLLGTGVIPLESLETISETIALTIGLTEGTLESVDDGVRHLLEAGADPRAARSAGKSLAVVGAPRGTVATATTNGRLPAATGQNRTRRL